MMDKTEDGKKAEIGKSIKPFTLHALRFTLYGLLVSYFLLLGHLYAINVCSDGLGGAGVSVVDGLDSLRVNPSGLNFLPENQIALNLGKKYYEKDSGLIIGLDYAHFVHGVGFIGGYAENYLIGEYSDFSFGLALGRPASLVEDFLWGAKLGVASDKKESATYLDVTLGARYKIREYFLGCAAYNLPNQERRAQIGISRKFEENLISLDFDSNSKVYIGSEFGVYSSLGKLRLGINTAQKSFNIGFGAYLWPYGLDALWSFPWSPGNQGTFAFSFIYRFGNFDFSQILLNRNTEKAISLERRIVEMKANVSALSQKLSEMEDAYKKAKDFVEILDAESSALIKKKLAEMRGSQEQQKTPVPTVKEPSSQKPIEVKTWPRKHIVVPGDSLRSLAQQYYGDSNKWQTIYDANRDKIERGLPKIGAELTIPKLQ